MSFKKLFYAFLAGILGIFAFAPFSLKFLIFASYAYLIYILIHNKSIQIKEVFAWGFGHWGFGMSWIIVSVYYYGETSIAVSSIIYLLLIIILTLVFTCPLLLISYINNITNVDNKMFKILFVSSSLMVGEISREYLLNGVPWLIPGNIYLDTISQNIYPIFGASFNSFIIYLLCSYLVFSNNNKKINLLSLGLILLSIFPQQSQQKNGELLVSIIQPSTDPFQKYESNYFSFIENNLVKLINQTSKNTQLIVLPEAELPYPINNKRFKGFIEKTGAEEKLVLGAWLFEESALFNTIYVPNNNHLYKKTHLVPFGEYIPFVASLRGLITFFDLPMSNVEFGPPNQDNLTIINKYSVATPICFDIAFPNTVRKMNKSSDFIINISNDTWFGTSIGPHHHLNMARIRAIENNRWVIRSTNDGFSAIISNKGTIVHMLKKGETSILEGRIIPINERSFYNSYGYLFATTFSLIFFLLSILYISWIRIKK
ncbi:MAG: apolipoprotein N-acyltransferase [Gammaproteobacteria bacterium]|nr:apolipoprotein N-acyltransferase [Gammaproteobacteria bacterium]|tara:strand:- start:2932 stop:4389 length:1458 start_codon:yes stop_codon:yes gene_type:complete